MSALDRRLRRIEGRIRPESDGAARAHAAALCAFLTANFDRGPGETLADIAARCCRLPDAPAFREALAEGLSADAVTAAGAALRPRLAGADAWEHGADAGGL